MDSSIGAWGRRLASKVGGDLGVGGAKKIYVFFEGHPGRSQQRWQQRVVHFAALVALVGESHENYGGGVVGW